MLVGLGFEFRAALNLEKAKAAFVAVAHAVIATFEFETSAFW
jgi:hypothetical protein